MGFRLMIPHKECKDIHVGLVDNFNTSLQDTTIDNDHSGISQIEVRYL